MTEILINKIENDLKEYDRGAMSGELVVSWLKIHLESYRLHQPKMTVQDEIDSRNSILTYHGGTNPND